MKHKKMDSIIADVLAHTPTSCVSIVYGSQNEIEYQKAVGAIHPSSPIEVTAETMFDIQSITKVVATASLLEKFVSQNKLSLNDPVIKYVPAFIGLNKEEVTIQHLLLHTSGISDGDFLEDISNDFSNDFETHHATQSIAQSVTQFKTQAETQLEPREMFWNKMLTSELHFIPGDSLEYTDVGYRILGLCLERIGQDSLENLSRKFIWDPLEMHNTTYHIKHRDKKKVAGQGNSWGEVDDLQDKFLNQPLGCDGVFSSTTDLISFCKYWLSKINAKESHHALEHIQAGEINPQWSFFESLGIGKKCYGWEVHSKEQSYLGGCKTPRALEKAGGAGAFICIRPEYNDFFIYLTNYGRPNPFSMEAWNNLVSQLKVQEIAKELIAK